MKTVMRGIGVRPPSFPHSYHQGTLNAISIRYTTRNRSSKHATCIDGTCQLKSTAMYSSTMPKVVDVFVYAWFSSPVATTDKNSIISAHENQAFLITTLVPRCTQTAHVSSLFSTCDLNPESRFTPSSLKKARVIRATTPFRICSQSHSLCAHYTRL